MIKYISIFRLVFRCLLVARKANLTGISTGLTGRSKNLDPTGNPTGRSTRPVPVDPTGFHLWFKPLLEMSNFWWTVRVFTYTVICINYGIKQVTNDCKKKMEEDLDTICEIFMKGIYNADEICEE